MIDLILIRYGACEINEYLCSIVYLTCMVNYVTLQGGRGKQTKSGPAGLLLGFILLLVLCIQPLPRPFSFPAILQLSLILPTRFFWRLCQKL